MPTTGSVAPLPTMMEEGKEDGDMVTIPGLEAMCEVAPESITQSEVRGGGLRETVLKALARDWVSQVDGDHIGGGACGAGNPARGGSCWGAGNRPGPAIRACCGGGWGGGGPQEPPGLEPGHI